MKRRYELGVGCLMVVALAATAFMALQVGAITGIGARQVRVTVPMKDAQGVSSGAMVAIAGVEVGSVEGLSVAHDLAMVTLLLDEDAAIRRDARVRVRSRSVLGEKYIALLPGSQEAPLLAEGDVLAPALPRTEIDELVNALGPLLEELEPAVVADALAGLGAALREDQERLPRMLSNADEALAQLVVASREAPALIAEGRHTLQTANRALAAIEDRASEASAVIERSNQILEQVDASVEETPVLLEEVQLTVAEARALLATLEGSADALETVLSNLSEIDRWELRRLLREEGVMVRLRPAEVIEGEEDARRPRIKGK